MADESADRYRVAFDLSTRIATAEGKYNNTPSKDEDARSYWIDLFDLCLAVSNTNSVVREEARSRAKAYKAQK